MGGLGGGVNPHYLNSQSHYNKQREYPKNSENDEKKHLEFLI